MALSGLTENSDSDVSLVGDEILDCLDSGDLVATHLRKKASQYRVSRCR